MESEAEAQIAKLNRFCFETLEQYDDGEISASELEKRWEDMRSEIRDANQLWENAGK